MDAGGSAGKKAPPLPGNPEPVDQKPVASAPSSASTGNPVAADGEAGASQAENVVKHGVN